MTAPVRVLPFPTAPLRLVILRTLARRPLFGTMRDGRFHPSRLGALARQFWLNLPLEYPDIGFDWVQVQPTAVVALVRAPRTRERDQLRSVVAHYKALVSRSAGLARGTWEPGYDGVPVVSGVARAARRGVVIPPGDHSRSLLPEGREGFADREK